jgi:acylphosphatase
MAEPIERWSMLAEGRVQMVGYRARVQHEAKRHHLVGKVWNDPRDLGRVWIEVQGPPRIIEEFRMAIARDQGASHPRSVARLTQLDPDPGAREFEIDRSKE